MDELAIRHFTLEMLDSCVDLHMRVYSQKPWNKTWESPDVVAIFYKNHFACNRFV